MAIRIVRAAVLHNAGMASLSSQIDLNRVARSGVTAEGPIASRLEEAFSERFAAHAVATNSGTSGLFAALIAVGVDRGSTVAVPGFGFTAAALAIRLTGADAVFVDVDDAGLIRPDGIPSDVDAVVAIDLDGQIAAIDEIRRRLPGVPIVEDACPAIGSETVDGHPAGTLGDVGVFSGNQTKKWSAGEGGMLLTATDGLAARARAAIRFGELDYQLRSPRQADLPGINGKMPELSAALGLNNLAKLDAHVRCAHEHGTAIREELDDRGFAVVPARPHQVVAWHKIRLVSDDRSRLVAWLEAAGLPFSTTDIDVVARHPLFVDTGQRSMLPGSFRFLESTLSIGDRMEPVWSSNARQWPQRLRALSEHRRES